MNCSIKEIIINEKNYLQLMQSVQENRFKHYYQLFTHINDRITEHIVISLKNFDLISFDHEYLLGTIIGIIMINKIIFCMIEFKDPSLFCSTMAKLVNEEIYGIGNPFLDIKNIRNGVEEKFSYSKFNLKKAQYIINKKHLIR